MAHRTPAPRVFLLRALALFVAQGATAPTFGKGSADQRVLKVAILESLKPNARADWTQVAADEYEYGLRAGAALCETAYNVKLEYQRFYFAGKSDPAFSHTVQDAVQSHSDVIIAPGNHENIEPAINQLRDSKVISPLARGVDLINGIPGFVPMFMPDDLLVQKFILATKRHATHKIIAIYSPVDAHSVSIRDLLARGAKELGLTFSTYPMATFSPAEAELATRMLEAESKNVNGSSPVVVVPFGTREVLALASAFQKSDLQPTIVGVASLPPQFALISQEEGLTIRTVDIRLYDRDFISESGPKNWYRSTISLVDVHPRTPLAFYVSAVMNDLCANYDVVKTDWNTFKNAKMVSLKAKGIWFAEIHDGVETFIPQDVSP